MIERVSFPSASGETASGALALPRGDARAPAVILVHEWWGLTDQITATAERLAAAGFVATSARRMPDPEGGAYVVRGERPR